MLHRTEIRAEGKKMAVLQSQDSTRELLSFLLSRLKYEVGDRRMEFAFIQNLTPGNWT